MTNSKFYSKFKSSIETLREAIDGEVNLDTEYPKIYKQVYRFYADQGVQLYGDVDDDYSIIMTELEKDLFDCGVLT